jgi:cobyrinic acid a,c-diamide synthase
MNTAPALLVAAAHKSSGKTTIALGLAAALRARGLAVQPFKKGPDYIDPMWLALAAGRPCLNLDPMLMAAGEIEATFADRSAGADLCMVEGNKGLYDGLALDGSNCNAALAKQLGLPVLLVIDARGMTRGIAPLILGYQAFDREVRIGGVILNRLGGSRHEAKLRAVIAHYTDVPVLGAVQADERLALVERHLGLVPARELDDGDARVHAMGRLIGEQIDLPAVLALAATRTPMAPPAPACAIGRAAVRAPAPRVRIGIARDKVFGFYYPDDLAALQAEGAELLPFDTLRDPALPPALDGLIIGGGFPELFMAGLEANVALRTALHRAISDGLPAYAECGGLMYLARSLHWQGRTARMAGVIPGDAVMHERPVGRGYARWREAPGLGWPDLAGSDGQALRAGHEFHHSSLENLPPDLPAAYRMLRGHGLDGRRDGLRIHNLLASYVHQRHTGGNEWPRRFMAFIRSVRPLAMTAAPAYRRAGQELPA